jgi:glycosyltransferase involved in cell wall biosynthesis
VRIALVGPGQPFRGGIAQHTDLLVTALSRSHEVTHLGFKRQYPRWLFGGRSDQDPSLPAREGRSERILDPLNPISWWRTAKRLATLAPDLVILPWWVPYWAPSFSATLTGYRHLAGASAAPVLFICHNVLPHDEPGLVIRLLVRHALRRADGWMLHGSSDEEALRRLLGRDLARREAGGHQRVFRGFLPLFDLGVVMEREDARALLGLPPDVPVALFFGFVRPYKGLQLLLAAWPRVLRSLPDSRLLIVGEFWEPVDAFWNRVRGLGIADSVVLVDRYVADEELGGYFGAADVVAMPYLSATGSAVAPLALRFGRPMVATAVGGIPEAVEHGLSGLLVPPNDAPALADALISVLGDSALRDRLTAGAELERGRFRWEELVSRIEAAAACLRAAE